MSMRKIDEIIIHCSATREGRHFTETDIDRWHRARGFNGIGYHYVIYLDGTVAPGRPESQIGAHCLGHNARSIGLCYIGGLGADGRPKDTRTPAQRAAIKRLTGELLKRYPGVSIHGHREFAAKACPSFDVAGELLRGLIPSLVLLILMLASCSTHKVATSEITEYSVTSEHSDTSELTAATELLEMEADSVRRVVEFRDSGQRRVTVSIYAPRMRKAESDATQVSTRVVREDTAAAAESTATETKTEPRGRGFIFGVLATLSLLGVILIIRRFRTQ